MLGLCPTLWTASTVNYVIYVLIESTSFLHCHNVNKCIKGVLKQFSFVYKDEGHKVYKISGAPLKSLFKNPAW